ncbi:NADPH:quinone reductase-like Zn-dependent oxidoreductase [Arthrobacter sp. JUb119]|nr:NADPH:quinone reductase-like Zn-dependent oxidoreductase [Arthrobacter sp. JUb119]
MHAFVLENYKGALVQAEVAEPELGEREVLIEIAAAGVNQLDEKIRAGEFKAILPYKMPLVLGHDVAGTVIGLGSGVRGFTVGDQIFARPRDHRIGAFAQRMAVNEMDIAKAPVSIDLVQAASLPLVALTAWQALVERGNLQPGQRVLIHPGAGGVGTIAIQLAKHLGAYVATTASATNAEFLQDLGADEVIDYKTEDFQVSISGYDLVLDSLGGETLAKSLGVLRPGGKVIGISGPPTPAFAKEAGLNPVMGLAVRALSRSVLKKAKKLGVGYEFLFMKPSGQQLRGIAELVDSGVLTPVVGQVFGFAQTAEALESMEAGGRRGKTVITMQQK